MTSSDLDEQDRRDMARLTGGEDDALDELMGRHAGRLFHYLIRVLQNETEAADLAEETFVRVYLNRTRYDARNRFTTWLYTIATNLARDLRRQRSRHPHLSLEEERSEPGHDFREILPDSEPTPRDRLEAAERAEAVRRAVAALPEELRFPLVLFEYEDKSHAEIGAILGCSAKAVEMRLYRARQQLRTRLGNLLTAP